MTNHQIQNINDKRITHVFLYSYSNVVFVSKLVLVLDFGHVCMNTEI